MSSSLPRRGRHPVSIGHLVMGLALLGLVGVWAVVQSDAVSDEDIRWLLPVPWVLAGAAGLVATTLSARRRGGGQAGTAATMPPAEPAEPSEHEDPSEPSEPSGPSGPSGPSERSGPSEPSERSGES